MLGVLVTSRLVSPEDLMQSVVNIVNNTVLATSKLLREQILYILTKHTTW